MWYQPLDTAFYWVRPLILLPQYFLVTNGEFPLFQEEVFFFSLSPGFSWWPLPTKPVLCYWASTFSLYLVYFLTRMNIILYISAEKKRKWHLWFESLFHLCLNVFPSDSSLLVTLIHNGSVYAANHEQNDSSYNLHFAILLSVSRQVWFNLWW